MFQAKDASQARKVALARRILDPMHATKLATLVEALRVLGRRLVVGVEKAA